MMTFDSIMFSYGTKRILSGVYLTIPRGKIVGLYGINGSGKSTLLKIGSGHLKEADGNVFINKESYFNKSLINNFKKIAYLSQKSFLPTDLSIKNIVERNRYDEKPFKKDELIGKIYSNKIHSISGGELRYFEIKLLFALDREFYLLDEPFSGIEPILIEKIILLLIEAKRKGKGILITDHFYRYVNEVNDISYVLKDGICYKINKNNIDVELFQFGYKAHV